MSKKKKKDNNIIASIRTLSPQSFCVDVSCLRSSAMMDSEPEDIKENGIARRAEQKKPRLPDVLLSAAGAAEI